MTKTYASNRLTLREQIGIAEVLKTLVDQSGLIKATRAAVVVEVRKRIGLNATDVNVNHVAKSMGYRFRPEVGSSHASTRSTRNVSILASALVSLYENLAVEVPADLAELASQTAQRLDEIEKESNGAH